jgi:hypothetical protein
MCFLFKSNLQMSYFIKHLVETNLGRKLVNVRDVLTKTCNKCKSQNPVFFYGETHVYKETCVYTTDKIVEEYRNTPKGFLPKRCQIEGCNRWKY